jgi:hypothetical protein
MDANDVRVAAGDPIRPSVREAVKWRSGVVEKRTSSAGTKSSASWSGALNYVEAERCPGGRRCNGGQIYQVQVYKVQRMQIKFMCSMLFFVLLFFTPSKCKKFKKIFSRNVKKILQN